LRIEWLFLRGEWKDQKHRQKRPCYPDVHITPIVTRRASMEFIPTVVQ
jgi:hypothetical protein